MFQDRVPIALSNNYSFGIFLENIIQITFSLHQMPHSTLNKMLFRLVVNITANTLELKN